MEEPFVKELNLRGFLSFPPDSEPIELRSLNVLIGPNGSGKSNLIEAFELLRATPTDFAAAIRDGGGPAEWLWKGGKVPHSASIDGVINANVKPLRYRLEFTAVQQRVEIVDEALEEVRPAPGKSDVFFYYRFQRGSPAINIRQLRDGPGDRPYIERHLRRDTLAFDQSVFSQRKDPDLYPEVTRTAEQFSAIQTLREWSFGRYTLLRQPQRADLPNDHLLPDASNLALVLNQAEHQDNREFNRSLKRLLPRFQRLSTLVQGGTVQFFLHEAGLAQPIPPTRLSDGTIHFLALLAVLLAPNPPPLLCIEEPELGLHPDAVELIAELLVDASERTQIVVTTHSDVLVSALSEHAELVLVCENLGNATVLGRLESDRLRFWLEKYRLGEIWRIGELGGNT